MRSDELHTCLKLVAVLALTITISVENASAQIIINQFDDASEISQWGFNFGGVGHTEVFDATVDADGNPASGSMKVTMTFDTALGGDNKGAYLRNYPAPGLDSTMLTGIKMDVMVDPNSAVDAFGNNGFFSLVLRYGSGYQYVDQVFGGVSSASGWIHFEKSPLVAGSDPAIRGVTFQLYGGPNQNLNGPVTLWIDNVLFSSDAPAGPPPELVIKRAIPGLQIAASLANEQYQRQDIRTTNSNFSWLIAGNPAVTYSFTITNFPNEIYNAYEAHLFLVGNSPSPGQFGDYNQPNVVYLRIYENPTGSGYNCELRYKANTPNLSGAAATLVASFSAPTVVGTWGVTLQNLDATIFGPLGATASGTLGMDVQTAFEMSTHVYLGIIPNDLPNIGQSVTFSGVSVTGATTPLIDNFSTLDNWTSSVAQTPTSVLLKPPGTFALICWPASSAGYTLHATNSLVAGEATWPFAGLPVQTLGTNKVVTLGPGENTRFFRLENPNL